MCIFEYLDICILVYVHICNECCKVAYLHICIPAYLHVCWIMSVACEQDCSLGPHKRPAASLWRFSISQDSGLASGVRPETCGGVLYIYASNCIMYETSHLIWPFMIIVARIRQRTIRRISGIWAQVAAWRLLASRKLRAWPLLAERLIAWTTRTSSSVSFAGRSPSTRQFLGSRRTKSRRDDCASTL